MTISPKPTHKAFIKNAEGVFSKIKEISYPTITALQITGAKSDKNGMPKNLIFLHKYVIIDAIRVADVPIIISIGLKEAIFPRIQPIVSPGIA